MKALRFLFLAGALIAPLLAAGSSLNRYTFEHPGWAATPGGRDGKILRVTTLAANGPGSLRAALEGKGPRIVVFEVGGVIDLQGASWRIDEPFITIAGQTAPDPGITLIKGALNIATTDVIVQHLSFRPGEFGRPKRGGGDHDGISTLGGAARVIVDHCSFSWATDENLSASGPRFQGATPDDWRRSTSHHITFSHNLIYEGLSHSVHAKGEHSKGSLVHDNITGILIFGNVYASNKERNALFKGGVRGAMVNNLIYNPGTRAVHYNLNASEWAGQPHQLGRLSLVGNVYRAGPDTVPGLGLFGLGGVGDVELFMSDNLASDVLGQPLPLTWRYTQSEARMIELPQADLPPGLQPLEAQRLEAELPLVAGARPWARDAIDLKLLADVAEGRGGIIDSELENQFGHPRYAPTSRPFEVSKWNLRDMSPKAGWGSLKGKTAKP